MHKTPGKVIATPFREVVVVGTGPASHTEMYATVWSIKQKGGEVALDVHRQLEFTVCHKQHHCGQCEVGRCTVRDKAALREIHKILDGKTTVEKAHARLSRFKGMGWDYKKKLEGGK